MGDIVDFPGPPDPDALRCQIDNELCQASEALDRVAFHEHVMYFDAIDEARARIATAGELLIKAYVPLLTSEQLSALRARLLGES